MFNVYFSLFNKISITWIKRERTRKRIEYLIINHCMIGAQNVYGVQSIFYSFLSSTKSITLKEERMNSEKKRIEYLIINHRMIGIAKCERLLGTWFISWLVLHNIHRAEHILFFSLFNKIYNLERRENEFGKEKNRISHNKPSHDRDRKMWASARNMVHFLTGAAQHTPCRAYSFLSSTKVYNLKEERENEFGKE